MWIMGNKQVTGYLTSVSNDENGNPIDLDPMVVGKNLSRGHSSMCGATTTRAEKLELQCPKGNGIHKEREILINKHAAV